MKAVLDAGALVAIDRRDRMIGARLRVLQQQGTPIRVSAAVVGQAWRDGRRQANLARLLVGFGTVELDDGKRIGEVLAVAGTSDVIDAHVALMADHGDVILTSDPKDIRRLMRVRDVAARIDHV